jgi:hypothetical protein
LIQIIFIIFVALLNIMASGYTTNHWISFWLPPKVPIVPHSTQYTFIAPLVTENTDISYENNYQANHLLCNRIPRNYYDIMIDGAKGVARPVWVKFAFTKFVLILQSILSLLYSIQFFAGGLILEGIVSIGFSILLLYLVRKAASQYLERMSTAAIQMNKILGELSNMLLSNTNVRAKAGLNCFWVEFYSMEGIQSQAAVMGEAVRYNPVIVV